MMYQSNTTKLYHVYYNNKHNIELCCVLLIHHFIFMYVLNTLGWLTLNFPSLDAT